MNTNWEYQTITFGVKNGVFSGPQLNTKDITEKLNALGSEGWELVSMTPIKESSGHSTALLLASLKRPCAA